MVETLVELKVSYHELEEQILQAHNEMNLYIRAGEKSEAAEAEREMNRLISERSRVIQKIYRAANSLDDAFGPDEGSGIPA